MKERDLSIYSSFFPLLTLSHSSPPFFSFPHLLFVRLYFTFLFLSFYDYPSLPTNSHYLYVSLSLAFKIPLLLSLHLFLPLSLKFLLSIFSPCLSCSPSQSCYPSLFLLSVYSLSFFSLSLSLFVAIHPPFLSLFLNLCLTVSPSRHLPLPFLCQPLPLYLSLQFSSSSLSLSDTISDAWGCCVLDNIKVTHTHTLQKKSRGLGVEMTSIFYVHNGKKEHLKVKGHPWPCCRPWCFVVSAQRSQMPGLTGGVCVCECVY